MQYIPCLYAYSETEIITKKLYIGVEVYEFIEIYSQFIETD
jgi:hypothetical protein